jgi:hypothetical protein
MTDRYKSSESNVEIEIQSDEVPKLVYLILFLFLLEAISVIVINLAGAYGIEPVEVISVEMLIVIVATLVILWLVWNMARKGDKSLSGLIYIFMGISLVFDGPNWLRLGLFAGIPEVLTFVNFVLLLVALYLVKVRLNAWFVK